MNDIEDIETSKQNIKFLKELIKHDFKSDKDYNNIYKNIRKQLKICPSKPTLRKLYHELLVENKIKENKSFLQYSLKKRGKSSSGVSVITILTSPEPEYTNFKGEKVKQMFTCGENCSYCPNEPEVILDLKIININNNAIEVSTFDEENETKLKLIRVISYIKKNNITYDIINSYNFCKNSFKIDLKTTINLNINDIITGFKRAQPRSYLSTEPAVIRANRNKFNPILQIYDRTDSLINCGHIVDKIEMLVLGGTWDHYPLEYQKEFIRDIYFGVNTLVNKTSTKLSLEEEIKINETAKKRLIGLTLETRPDCINLKQIRKLRKFNVTRLQIGVQHIDNDILKNINRGCTNEDTIFGNYLWKQNGGKIDWHLMPDLPGSSLEKDINMFKKIFGVYSIVEINKNHFIYNLKHPELQADQLKIYPCTTVDWTKIKEWYEDGSYKPYSENEKDITKVIKYIENNVFPWIRLNRIIRDIPTQNIIGGNKITNLRQKIYENENISCNCIRSREVKDNIENIDKAELVIREYNGLKSIEYFISFESPDKKLLYGFLRLRINYTNDDLIFNELKNCAHIRELHVYGNIIDHSDKKNKSSQHIGFGKRLLEKAEEITIDFGIPKIAIISGVGVREYYRKRGYYLEKDYMFKNLYTNTIKNKILYIIIISLIYYIIVYI
jgi:ELP3 family radical SAM enzyme/protein acetyltransferase